MKHFLSYTDTLLWCGCCKIHRYVAAPKSQLEKGQKYCIGLCAHKYNFYNILNIKIKFHLTELAIRTPSRCGQKFILVKVRNLKTSQGMPHLSKDCEYRWRIIKIKLKVPESDGYRYHIVNIFPYWFVIKPKNVYNLWRVTTQKKNSQNSSHFIVS
jgi:hypothetical protein